MSTSLLSSITGPEDIKNFSIEQLNELAAQTRQRIIDVLSVTGGHLSSNLGTVELSIAMHKVFNSPLDKFIFDVSHQSYTHKILTGRNDRLEGIRQFKGLCGFTHPEESKHDHFHAGHAGTALSLGLGVAKQRALLDDDYFVVPVLGDASLTCGVTLEALNNISRNLKKFVVILNDNAMSISDNVGAVSHILGRILNNPKANKLYQGLDSWVSKIPSFGDTLSRQGKKITESLKGLFSCSAFFEQYGLSYIGPIDGHNIEELTQTLEGIKDSSWPVLIHVLTTKGKGLPEAEKNATSHHGAKPFDPTTGKFRPSPSTKPTFPKVFGSHLLDMAKKDASIVAVTPAMSFGSQLDPFMKTYPDRCIDVGIAESHAVTFCGGIASNKKLKVVMSIYASFLQRALDNLFHDVCLQELPVIFAIDRAGLSPGDGATHHGIYDISFLRAMPNMIIAQPRNVHVLKELMESAFSWQQPVAIRYPNLPSNDEPNAILRPREIGRGEVLAHGEDVLILGLGHMCNTAMELRELLKDLGINATVADPVFVKPLDKLLLEELLETHKTLITIEEHSLESGLGNAVNHFLAKQHINDINVMNFGIPDTFVQQGSYKELMEELNLNAEQIFNSFTQSKAFEHFKAYV
jgi:1-deoxy-D-xylulose-5-phosphate synthase